MQVKEKSLKSETIKQDMDGMNKLQGGPLQKIPNDFGNYTQDISPCTIHVQEKSSSRDEPL